MRRDELCRSIHALCDALDFGELTGDERSEVQADLAELYRQLKFVKREDCNGM